MPRPACSLPTRRALLAAAPALALPGLVRAQVATGSGWPQRSVRFIVPFAPGGPVEVPARFIADHLSQRLGKPVIVEARPGAGGALGIQAALAARDEHTFIVTTGSVAILPVLMKNPGYDPFADLIPVALVSEVPLAFLARPDGKVKDMAGLLAQAKAQPGRISYGSSGAGSTTHLAGELLKIRAGIDLLHVPYRGTPAAIVALRNGEVQVVSETASAVLGQIRSGEVRALAITSRNRSPLLPEVPTVAEALGHPDFDIETWYAIAAPAGTPPSVVERIMEMARGMSANEDLRGRLGALGLAPRDPGTPASTRAAVHNEIARWAEVIERTRMERQ